MKHHDIAIIGGSVAGGSLASSLGRKGLEVALIDHARFPRRKACGEGLSNVAIGALQRMGIEIGPALQTGVAYYGYRICHHGRSFSFASGRKHLLRGVGVQRLHLDQMILDGAAASPSLTTYLETSVSEITRDRRGHCLELSSGQRISARQLVLADGANSVNAAKLGIPVQRKKKPLWGISFIMKGSYAQAPAEVVVVLKKGFEINCTPVSTELLNITFLAEKRCVKALQDPQIITPLLEEAMEQVGFAGSAIDKPLNVGPVNHAKRPYVHDSIMLLGDAAENLDPIAGMGMTHAVLMAEIASELLHAHLREGLPIEEVHAIYAKRAAHMGRAYRGFTRLTASLLRSPLRGALLPVAAATILPELVRRTLDREPGQPTLRLFLPHHFISVIGV